MSLTLFFSQPFFTHPITHLLVALLCGALIGLERTYHGRAAGARTYALVCMASALMLQIFGFPVQWLSASAPLQNLVPTQVMQGIMTGIGFLGAGVIVKEGFSVRGLTTAAAIWATAAIGIVIGSGFLVPGVFVTLLTVVILALLRSLENRFASQQYAHCLISFAQGKVLSETSLRAMLSEHRLHVVEISYENDRAKGLFCYEIVLWSHFVASFGALAESLSAQADVLSFRIAPSRD